MNKKKFAKNFLQFVKHPLVKLVIYLTGLVFVLYISGILADFSKLLKAIYEAILSEDTLSICFAGLLSLGVAKGASLFDYFLEESLKTEDDHHKIITQYSKHKQTDIPIDASHAEPGGQFLRLYHTRKQDRCPAPAELAKDAPPEEKKAWKKAMRLHQKKLRELNDERDPQSSAYNQNEKNIREYLNGKLCLASVNVFANIAGDTQVRFDDKAEAHVLPDFVIAHAEDLLQAHKNSKTSNKDTVRLNNFSYDGHTLTLHTSRSTYYHMLITNRCMDFKFANGLSIRELYEYENKICPLEHSKFGNQIGINGLIISSDGYLLIEKRDRKKSTWKNKFAQSISLALKAESLGVDRRNAFPADPQSAENRMRKIIEDTIKSNFGLTPDDYKTFEMQSNFLGLARDLLEGGKPNLYFYVETKHTAKELKAILEDNVKVTKESNQKNGTNRQVISTSKLDSNYYLVNVHDLEIDHDYQMCLRRHVSLTVHRKFHPRCSRLAELWDQTKSFYARRLHLTLKRECGEALLVTLAYLELRWAHICQQKAKANQPKEEKRIVAFGEIMLRFTPEKKDGSIAGSKGFQASYGGTESNVLVALSTMGNATRYLTKLPDNDLGTGAIRHLERYGVDCGSIVSAGNNLGMYFLEESTPTRPAKVIYARKQAEVTTIKPEDIDYDAAFADCSLFHISGISFALSPSVQETCFRLIDEAKKRNIPVSFDFNYRSKLWSEEEAAKIYARIVPLVDIVMGSRLDLTGFLGIAPEDYFRHYPNTKYLSLREREILSPGLHRIKASLYTPEDGCVATTQKDSLLLERIGGGDAYAAGFLHGLLHFEKDYAKILDYAASCFVLKNTVRGDILALSSGEIEAYQAYQAQHPELTKQAEAAEQPQALKDVTR